MKAEFGTLRHQEDATSDREWMVELTGATFFVSNHRDIERNSLRDGQVILCKYSPEDQFARVCTEEDVVPW